MQYGKRTVANLVVDVTNVALEWARKNVESNPHLSELIEIRDANDVSCSIDVEPSTEEITYEGETEPSVSKEQAKLLNLRKKMDGCFESHILVGVVRDGEKFDFCMCNPPFFESIEEAGQNPKTSCGGTSEEMVYHGGEQAFISHIIHDSVLLKNSFRSDLILAFVTRICQPFNGAYYFVIC